MSTSISSQTPTLSTIDSVSSPSMEPGADLRSGNLLRNCVLFGRLLRAVGLDVTPTQIVDLVDSLQHVDIRSRRDFK